MKKIISNIKTHANLLKNISEDELQLKVDKLKKRFEVSEMENKKIFSPAEYLIEEWFAMVQEVSTRRIGLRHFDTQLLAGFLLHQGNIVEMKTGEGKTLCSTLPVSLNALSKKGVHVVTVNDYLAERDQKWMGKIYQGLGLSVGLVKSTSQRKEKQKSYSSDITYITNSELVFDYLRDSSAYNKNELVQRPFQYCILDEIDSILIDEARTPLILSNFKGDVNFNKLFLAKEAANLLRKGIDFEVDEKRRDINLTEEGYQEAKFLLGKESLYDPADPWILEILNALKAKYIFQLNKDYIILNNKVCIVDEFTGRIMEDRRWSMGIHEAVEIKENVEPKGETKTKSSITYQNFFTLYPKLAGMTGTGKTAEKEFQDIYNLDVVVVPTAKPMIRKDLSDFVYQNELSKWKAVLNQSKECFNKGQPILIGTASVEKSEFLADLFKASKIPHQVLNAKPENVFRESEIIAQAGERYAVTIATNMAGRGTDIILGGNPIYKVKQVLSEIFLTNSSSSSSRNTFSGNQKVNTDFSLYENLIKALFQEYNTQEKYEDLEKHIENLPYSLEIAFPSLNELYKVIYQETFLFWKGENEMVQNLGGLFVLGTERHETRRIDNQLRGRSGRQGDPGCSQFFVSLDDELIKVFGGDSIRRWVEYLIQDKDVPLESNMLTNSLEKAQEKVELYNYDIRKNVFQYDEVLNNQRKQLFEARQEILYQNKVNELSLRAAEMSLDSLFINEKNLTETSVSLKFPDIVLIVLQELNQSLPSKGPFQWIRFPEKIEINFDAYSDYSRFQEILRSFSFSFSDSFSEAPDDFLKIWKDETKENKKMNYSEIWISNDLRFSHSNLYQFSFLKNNHVLSLLETIDFYWTEHLERMSYIRETINWRSYGQQNPLVEYNNEAFNSFTIMFQEIRTYMLYSFLSQALID